MKNIHENNCEAFFLDYFEGRLNDKQQQLLFTFLGENPEWKKVFDEYGEIPEEDVFLSNDSTADQANSADVQLQDEEYDLIALLEGQLNATDAQKLEEKLESDTVLATAFSRYELTRLKPDLDIVYPHKQALKKGAPVFSLFASYSAVAALMAGAFIAVWVFSIGEHTVNVAQYNPRPLENIKAAQSASIAKEKPGVSSQAEEESASSVIEESPVETFEVASVTKNQNEKSGTGKPVGATATSPEVVASESNLRERIEMEVMGIKMKQNEVLASLDIDKPRLVKSNKPDQLPDHSPENEPPQPTTKSGGSERSLFGSFLSEIGQSVVDRVKAATDEDVVIEKEERQEDELVTSTFKLGAFEVYRCKSNK